MQAALFIASGIPYFLGLALTLLALILSAMRRPPSLAVRILTTVAVVLVVASGTPAWSVLAAALALVLAVYLIVWPHHRVTHRLRVRASFLYSVLVIAGIALEAMFWQTPRLSGGAPTAVFIIGDSLSAGVRDDESPWPALLSDHQRIAVTNLAQAGATTRTAAHQLELLVNGGSPSSQDVVIVLIGGNDILSGRPAQMFEHDLDAVLSRLADHHARTVMFELPVPPLYSEFVAIQRRLAAKYQVALIPRYRLAFALMRSSDGLHLSEAGHDALRKIADEVLQWP